MDQSLDPLFELESIPIASIVSRPESEDEWFLSAVNKLPSQLKALASSEKTGAYIRGILKSYDIEQQKIPQFSFIIMQIIIGTKKLSDLGGLLSAELRIANDKAQKMAAELEHDLFAPVAGELNDYLAKRNREMKKIENKATGNPRAAGATNVLDLKDSGAQRRLVPPALRKRSNP